MRVLVVDDDQQVSKLIRRLLETERHNVMTAFSGEDALEKARMHDFDAVILDWVLPDIPGPEVCVALREMKLSTPVLMLTGKGDTDAKVFGLDSGADDYLVKPYEPDELLARLRSLMRRPATTQQSILRVGDLELDPAAKSVRRGGEQINLMPKEYALLEYLMRNAGNALKKEDILAHVWGVYSNSASNRLEVYVRYLREKVDAGHEAKLIQTVRGHGYRIAA